jgi:hypothetical protein
VHPWRDMQLVVAILNNLTLKSENIERIDRSISRKHTAVCMPKMTTLFFTLSSIVWMG